MVNTYFANFCVTRHVNTWKSANAHTGEPLASIIKLSWTMNRRLKIGFIIGFALIYYKN